MGKAEGGREGGSSILYIHNNIMLGTVFRLHLGDWVLGGGSCPHERPMATFSTMSLYRVESLSGTSRDEIAGISYESGKAALKTALLAVVMMLAGLLSRVVAKPIIHMLL